MVKNIIFDIGKVLVSYEPDAYMESLGLDKKAREAVNKAMFQNKLWDISDQGIYTIQEMTEKFIAGAPEYEEEIKKLYSTVGNAIELFPHSMEWITSLKEQGFHLYILSNYSETAFEQTKEKLEFLSLVDGAVFSYECKMIKPQNEIYEYLCRKYALNCSECIFIDDRMENVQAARNNGIYSIQFKNYEQARAELSDMLK